MVFENGFIVLSGRFLCFGAGCSGSWHFVYSVEIIVIGTTI
jgi:hypothetical protein